MERIFRLFRFFGILGQPPEVHPKFRTEIPENICSIRSPTRNFWSNGKRPSFALLVLFRGRHHKIKHFATTYK